MWTVKSNSVVILVFIFFSKTRTIMLKSIKNYFCICSFLLGAKHSMARITRINLDYIPCQFTAFPVKSIHWGKNYIYIWTNFKYTFLFSTSFIYRRRQWQPTLVLLPGKSHERRSLPWMQEPGRLQSMGSWRVGHDWATSLSLLTFMHWRRKWQPTPVFLPGESQGRGSLVGCRLWGHTESDTNEAT